MPKYNICLVGPIGTGKTHSIRSLVQAGVETFVLATEPGIDKILGDLPEDLCHWNYVSPAETSWEVIKQNALLVNTNSMEALQKMAAPNRQNYRQFLDLVNILANFTDIREGKHKGESYGPVDDWDASRALVIDGLSGLSTMALDLVTGAKPIKTLPEWGAAMDNLGRLVKKLCYDTKCTFVLLAHSEREKDELTGGTQKKMSTLGNKLAPELAKPFDEIIGTKREGGKFYWTTNEIDMELKTRTLGWADRLDPNFGLFPNIGKLDDATKTTAA